MNTVYVGFAIIRWTGFGAFSVGFTLYRG